MRWVLITSLLLASCASAPGLYVEMGGGYKIRETTSYVLRPECHVVKSTDPNARSTASCGGDNPTAHFIVGYEITDQTRIDYHHMSHAFDGGVGRETHLDEFRLMHRWGGRDARR